MATSGSPVSTAMSFDCAVSTLPARSTDRTSRTWRPCAVTVNGAVYAVHVPLPMRYSVRATPEPASVAASVTFGAVVNQPALPSGEPGSVRTVVTGAVVSAGGPSTVNVRDCSSSTLPASSVERYPTVCSPSGTSTAPSYVVQAPPLMRYSVDATPEPSSSAASAKLGAVTYQPCSPSAVAGCQVRVVLGASPSAASTTTSRLVAASSLPATSVERNSTVWVPGSVITNGAV